MTTPLSEKEQNARKLARAALLLLPLYCIPAAMLSGWESHAIIITGAVLNVTLALVASVTRNSAQATIALLMPFASIAIGILAALNHSFRNW